MNRVTCRSNHFGSFWYDVPCFALECQPRLRENLKLLQALSDKPAEGAKDTLNDIVVSIFFSIILYNL